MEIKTTDDILNEYEDIEDNSEFDKVKWVRVDNVRKYFVGELKENSQKLIMNLLLKELK